MQDEEKADLTKEIADLKATIKCLEEKIKQLEKVSKVDKTSNDGMTVRLIVSLNYSLLVHCPNLEFLFLSFYLVYQ